MSGDVLMPAGDGTHRVIESDAIRALVGYVAQRDDAEDTPDLPQLEEQ